MPADAPTLAPYRPDWTLAVNDTMTLRPELVLARQELKVRQMEVINQKNLLLPDLRFTSTYGLSGIGSQLDGGSDPNNAFHSLATDRFTDWSLGLRLDIPIGFRDAHAAVRAARLLLAQSYAVLQDQELKAQRYLALQYRLLSETYERIAAARAQREAAAQQLTLRTRNLPSGVVRSNSYWPPRSPGPTLCGTSTRWSQITTTRWPRLNLPRARSCSETTSSSRKGRCPGAPAQSGRPRARTHQGARPAQARQARPVRTGDMSHLKPTVGSSTRAACPVALGCGVVANADGEWRFHPGGCRASQPRRTG